jgi:hypothetical protein
MSNRQFWRRFFLIFAALQVVTLVIAWDSWLEFGISVTIGIASLVFARMLRPLPMA